MGRERGCGFGDAGRMGGLSAARVAVGCAALQLRAEPGGNLRHEVLGSRRSIRDRGAGWGCRALGKFAAVFRRAGSLFHPQAEADRAGGTFGHRRAAVRVYVAQPRCFSEPPRETVDRVCDMDPFPEGPNRHPELLLERTALQRHPCRRGYRHPLGEPRALPGEFTRRLEPAHGRRGNPHGILGLLPRHPGRSFAPRPPRYGVRRTVCHRAQQFARSPAPASRWRLLSAGRLDFARWKSRASDPCSHDGVGHPGGGCRAGPRPQAAAGSLPDRSRRGDVVFFLSRGIPRARRAGCRGPGGNDAGCGLR